MQKFKSLTSNVIPLPIVNIDTDMIIPANFMTSTSREGYSKNVFRRLRDQDENFPFNLDKYKDASIIVAGDNFGCGSSREHAVWALVGWGIKVIIAPSFADIFASNSGKNGLVLVTLSKEIIDEITELSKDSNFSLSVDLEKQEVEFNGRACNFEYDSFSKHCILNGLDDIDYILSNQASIDKYSLKRSTNIFFDSKTHNRGK